MAQSIRKAYIVGVGMTKFMKPGTGPDYPELAHEAVQLALKDAGLTYKQVQQAIVGYVYGDSTCGQRALYSSGLTGIPIYNVNNNCSTGSSALYLAKQLVSGNQGDCILALGFERMEKGSLGFSFPNKTNPLDKHVQAMGNLMELTGAPITAQLFGNAGKEHMAKYGTTLEHFAKIALKNHNHGSKNERSQFKQIRTLEEILSSKQISTPLTKLMCCPTSDGSAAALVVSEDFVKSHNLEKNAVEILGMELATDLPSTFDEKSMTKIVGYDMSKMAADKVFQKTGRKITEVDVIELHDCFSANELITYEALGLCEKGKAGEFIDKGDNTYGGKYVVNPSGGLISKGHPLGATGLAQVAELCWQLRGEAGERQVQNCKLALAHNLGLGGAAVVSLLQLGFPGVAGRIQPPSSTSTTRLIHTSASSMAPGTTKSKETTNSDVSDFKCATIFNHISEILQSEGQEYVKKMNGVYGFQVSGAGGVGTWIVDVKNGAGSVEFGGTATPDVVLSIADLDLFDLMMGKLNAQKAFFQGKLKIKGNMGLAMKLKELQNPIAKLTMAKL